MTLKQVLQFFLSSSFTTRVGIDDEAEVFSSSLKGVAYITFSGGFALRPSLYLRFPRFAHIPL